LICILNPDFPLGAPAVLLACIRLHPKSEWKFWIEVQLDTVVKKASSHDALAFLLGGSL